MEAFSLLRLHLIILYSFSLAVSLLALVLLLDPVLILISTLVLFLDSCKIFSFLTMEA
jgi:hypothetical protein